MWGRKPILDRILERIWRRLLAKKDHESVPLLFSQDWNLINEQVWVLALAGYVVVLRFVGNALHSHILPISTQVYNWVPANLMLEVNLIWTDIPFRDSLFQAFKHKSVSEQIDEGRPSQSPLVSPIVYLLRSLRTIFKVARSYLYAC